MSTKRGNIIANLVASLNEMGVDAGYETDWQVGYAEIPDDEPGLFPAWMLDVGDEQIQTFAYPVLDWTLPVELWGVAKSSGLASSPTERNEIASGMIVDLVRAVMQDTTRGGLAIDTMPTSAQRIATGDPDVAVVVRVDVKYRTKMTDPRSGL